MAVEPVGVVLLAPAEFPPVASGVVLLAAAAPASADGVFEADGEPVRHFSETMVTSDTCSTLPLAAAVLPAGVLACV